MVEIGQRHATFVKPVQHRAQPIKDIVVENRSGSLPQGLGVDPPGGQSVRTEATEKGRQGIDPFTRRVSRRFAPDQPPSESVSNQGAALGICFHRHAIITEIVKKNISLGAVAPNNPPHRLEPGETLGVERIPAIRV